MISGSRIGDCDAPAGPPSGGHRQLWLAGKRAAAARAASLRQQVPAAEDRERPFPGQETYAADWRLSVLPYGTTHDPGVRSHAVAAQRIDFAGAWTVEEQNRLLSVCFGL